MAYEYDYIDGERVEVNVAAAYKAWAADFKAETGYEMRISSGTRTESEQARGYADYLAGRTKVKWAKPSESSHCEIGPSGPRALDIRDTGPDAGVTVKHTYRWNVAVRLGRKWGFTWGGWGVPDYEGWHFENHGVPVGAPLNRGGGKVPATPAEPAPQPEEEEDEDMAMKGAHYKVNGTSVYMLFNEVSGFYVEHSGVDGGYNNSIAQNWDTNTWPEISEKHAQVIKRSLDAIRRTAVTGSLSVDLS